MTTSPSPTHTPRLVQAFEGQVRATPDATAVSYGDTRLSYAQLDKRSNQLAHFLRDRGIGPDVVVAIAIPRSPEMAVAVLGVLKAGGGYAPLDPSYPQQRLAFMLGDTRAPVLLTVSSLASQLPPSGAQVVCVDTVAAELAKQPSHPLPTVTESGHLAYVIYTSGSTGNPKGVAMPHGPLENLTAWQLRNSALGVGDKTLQFAPLSFDVHFQEMFATWASGGELVLVDDELRLDAGRLLQLLDEQRVARLFLPFIALQSLADVAVMHGLYPRALREVVTAGEQLVVTKSLIQLFERLPGCSLHNHYGPSETHVVTAYTLQGAPATWPGLPPIGKAIDNSVIYVLDEQGKPLPDGEEGELYLGGVCVARGYLHRPDLSEAKFLRDPFSKQPGARMYRTGDLARIRPDGECEFLGRLDGQVKVRGYRIELGEIEVALDSHPMVRQAVVIAREDEPGDKRLVAYVMLQGQLDNLAGELRKHLTTRVPDYMLPSAFVVLAEFPRTPSGKIERRSLPRPEAKRPELETSYVAPRNELETALARLWVKLLKIDKVGVFDNFFDLGGNSLLALKTVAHLREEQSLDLPVVQIFAHPTVSELAAYLSNGGQNKSRARKPLAQSGAVPIAIVGMSGRFPGASDKDELWKVLASGLDTTTGFSPAELDPQVPAELKNDRAYVRRRGTLRDADKFDAAFFGVNPREAEVMDPQQRVLLETAWATLEDAGYAPERVDGAVGVFAGTHNNSYYVNNVLPRPDAVQQVGSFAAMVGNEKDYVATRIAHKLNLNGPALSIHTACSTSLVAVTVAVQSLRNGECDMALAGGASLTVPVNSGHLYQEGGMLSNDGHTRSFDANAQGTAFSDGAAMVALKRLPDALRDGDHVYAVIRGAAINNDGAHKVSFTAPSVEGQAAVIATAQAQAEIDPRSISYVEAHGTATPLGDPIEVEALTLAFREQTQERAFCALGSIKSNFGHLTAAAGVAGLVKTALALQNELIPQTVHFRTPNPRIDFANSPFVVVDKPTAWKRSATPRRAGISSFGVGGTNAHVVLEEAPVATEGSRSRPQQLLVLSARTADALTQAGANLKQYLTTHTDVSLPDVAFTLHAGRRAFSHRRYLVVRDVKDALAQLDKPDPRRAGSASTDRRDPEIVFMFPGQGSQYVGMGENLYRDEPLFRVVVDQCAEILLPYLGADLREVLYPADPSSESAAATLRRTEFTQAALFVVEYALATLWISWGVKPSLMVGHSVGEFVCAVLASVMRLEDALRLVAARGKVIQALPEGAMLSVRLPAATVTPRLHGQLAVASSNGPSLCVVAGPHDEVEQLRKTLDAEGVITKPLHTSHAFHSPMMDPAVAPFLEVVRSVTLSPPKIPFISTVTTLPIDDATATDPMYWATHLRKTVRFAEAVGEAWKQPGRVLLEVGPRTTLATLARQQVTDRKQQVAISSLGESADNDGEWTALLSAFGQLWLTGAAPSPAHFFQNEQRRRVPLPSYPFERRRHWLDAPVASAQTVTTRTPLMAPPAPSANGAARPSEKVTNMSSTTGSMDARKAALISKLKTLLEDASGIEFADADPSTTFLELGLDSLLLTQIAMSLKRQFGVEIGFRLLLEDLCNFDLLAGHLATVLPIEAVPVTAAAAAPVAAPAMLHAPVVAETSYAQPAVSQASVSAPIASFAAPLVFSGPASSAGSVQSVVEAQLLLMQQQLALLAGGGGVISYAEQDTRAPLPASVAHQALPSNATSPTVPVAALGAPSVAASTPAPGASPYLEGDEPIKPVKYDAKTAFGAIARIHVTQEGGLTAAQSAKLEAFTQSYNAKTKGSKQWAQENRTTLADPRVVTGFRPPIKELVYPILAVRSSGSRIWDVDGNEYIDALNGFGSNFLGHAPKLIQDALKEQIDIGYEIGPMQPMIGEAARLACELTGLDRAAFCNTGSEAVMGAMRVARTVTGRNLIAIFSGSYHGIFDEVIVRGTKRLRSVPAAPGIMPESVENVLVLEYGTPESMAIIKERAHELAAVMVEPVQSRRPDFQPVEFLRELREVTARAGAAYIWDEVITGFRAHQGGAQAMFGVQADLATYGKVAGGGMPLGMIAGKRAWMDALDGGFWQFGDESVPTVGVTYFAGTFVRHPLTMAATRATLAYLKEKGPALQQTINARTDRLANTLNAFFKEVHAPLKIKHFSSLWKTFYLEDHPMQDVLFCHLRANGIHIWDGFPCFLTDAHSDADVDAIIAAYKRSVLAMQDVGFLPGGKNVELTASISAE